MKIRTLSVILLACLTFARSGGQEPEEVFMREIDAEGDYTHPATGIVFPEQIESFERVGIRVFDPAYCDIRAFYRPIHKRSGPQFTVYAYPAGEACEDRLRSEYLYGRAETIEAQPSPGKFAFRQHPVRREGPQYICNGYTMQGSCPKGELTRLTVFECGKWFLKFHITAGRLDSAAVETLERHLLELFDPTALTAINPYRGECTWHIAPEIYGDSVLSAAELFCATARRQWADEHVPCNERASGFPGLYLPLHVEGLRAFLEQTDSLFLRGIPSEEATRCVGTLRRIADAGFLKEHVYDRYDRTMIVPDSMALDMDGYERWKAEAGGGIDLRTGPVSLSTIEYVDGEPGQAAPASPE